MARAKRQVLDFWAPWCGPCMKDAPKVEELKRKGVNVRKVNVDEEPALATQYNVTSLPTYVVLDENGKEHTRTQNVLVLFKMTKWLLKILLR